MVSGGDQGQDRKPGRICGSTSGECWQRHHVRPDCRTAHRCRNSCRQEASGPRRWPRPYRRQTGCRGPCLWAVSAGSADPRRRAMRRSALSARRASDPFNRIAPLLGPFDRVDELGLRNRRSSGCCRDKSMKSLSGLAKDARPENGSRRWRKRCSAPDCRRKLHPCAVAGISRPAFCGHPPASPHLGRKQGLDHRPPEVRQIEPRHLSPHALAKVEARHRLLVVRELHSRSVSTVRALP